MASNNYGYMARIGVDTTGMRQADSDMRNISRELREVDSLIEQTGGTTELYTQQQQLLAAQVNAVSGNLTQLRNHQAQVLQAFQNGNISAEMYRAYQRDVISAEASLQDLENRQNRVNDAMNRGGTSAITLGDILKSNLISGGVEKLAGLLKNAAMGLADFAREGIELSSGLTEVQNVVDVTFGENSSIYAFADTAAEKFGLTKLAAEQYAGTMGAMLKSSGINEGLEEMSINIASLAGDMASFYNISSDVAFEKLRSGISGETEPLKQLGINMSVVNLEAYAMSQGIKTSWESMSQAEQTMLRYNYILDQTKDAHGDFERTSDSLANQQRILELNIENVKTALGEELLPVAEKLIAAINDNMPMIEEAVRYLGENLADGLDESVNELIKFTAEDALPAAIEALKWIADNGDTVIGILEALAAAWAVDKVTSFGTQLTNLPTLTVNAINGLSSLATVMNGSVSTAFGNLLTKAKNVMSGITTAIQGTQTAAIASFAAIAAAAAVAIGSIIKVADELDTIAEGKVYDSKDGKQSKQNVNEISSRWDNIADMKGLDRYNAAVDYKDEILEREEDWNKRYKEVIDELNELQEKKVKSAAETARQKELQNTRDTLDAEWAMLELFHTKVDNELSNYDSESIRRMQETAAAQNQAMANAGRTNEDAISNVWEGIRAATKEKMDELDSQLAKHQITEENYWAERKNYLEKHRDEESEEWWKYYDDVTEYYEKAAETEKKAADKAASDAEKAVENSIKKSMENLKRTQKEQGLDDKWLEQQYLNLANSQKKGTDAYYLAYDAYLDIREKNRKEEQKQADEDAKQRKKLAKEELEDRKKAAEESLEELKKQHEDEVKAKKKEAEDNLSLLEETQEEYTKTAAQMSEKVKSNGKDRLILGDNKEETKKLQKYRNDMEKLKALGVSEELLDSVYDFDYNDGSRQMYINELLGMSANNRARYDKEYQEYVAEQKKTAEYDTGLKYEDERKSLQDAANGVLEEPAEQAYQWGVKAGENYIKGLETAIANFDGIADVFTMNTSGKSSAGGQSSGEDSANSAGNQGYSGNSGLQGISPQTVISINVAGKEVIRGEIGDFLMEKISSGGSLNV